MWWLAARAVATLAAAAGTHVLSRRVGAAARLGLAAAAPVAVILAVSAVAAAADAVANPTGCHGKTDCQGGMAWYLILVPACLGAWAGILSGWISAGRVRAA